MKLLLDQGTPRSAAALLREAGHDAVHTAEIGLADGRVGVAGVISTKGLRKLLFLSGPPSDAFGLQNRERERVGAGPGADGDSVEALA